VCDFLYGASLLLCGGVILLAGGLVAQFMSAAAAQAEDQDIAATAGALGLLVIFVGLGQVLVGGGAIAGGIGLLQRAPWGRLLTLVAGGVGALFAILNLWSVIKGNMVLGVLQLLFNGGFATLVFVILLKRRYADEFR
jgi:hypothetical protein